MKSYFSFSKGQKIGVVTIAIIIIVLTVLLNKESRIGIPDPFDVDASQYEMLEDGNDYSTYDKQKPNHKSYKPNYTLSQFDPNVYNVEDWEKIGFSNKQSKSIVSFKNKLGGFKTKEDLKKSFVISDKKYLELEPYINIIKTASNNQSNQNFNENKNLQDNVINIVELNSATQKDLMSVKGIGEFTSKKIIEYRTKLGGFHSPIQLNEVYGITPENYERIITQIEVDESKINKLKINTLSISQLKKHPYISWNCAKSIIDERFKGKIIDLQFLLINDQLTQDEIDLLYPYIEF